MATASNFGETGLPRCFQKSPETTDCIEKDLLLAGDIPQKIAQLYEAVFERDKPQNFPIYFSNDEGDVKVLTNLVADPKQDLWILHHRLAMVYIAQNNLEGFREQRAAVVKANALEGQYCGRYWLGSCHLLFSIALEKMGHKSDAINEYAASVGFFSQGDPTDQIVRVYSHQTLIDWSTRLHQTLVNSHLFPR